jgi:hypothetical protein
MTWRRTKCESPTPPIHEPGITIVSLLKDANVVLQNWLSDSRVKRIWNRGDFKSMVDGIEYKLTKFREAFEVWLVMPLHWFTVNSEDHIAETSHFPRCWTKCAESNWSGSCCWDVRATNILITHDLEAGRQSLIDDSTRVKLRDWLKAADVGRNQKAAEDRHHPGTGKWFLEGTPEFQRWKYSLHSLLWLHGICMSFV